MKKRMLSLLLALCLLLSCLPIGALAVTPEELYLQMLELGLVDEDGTLIENNRFTVEDGTVLSSLEELRLWLHALDERDFGLEITVDATGKTATAEQLMQALNIEYQIADVAEQLRLLASGALDTQSTGTASSAHDKEKQWLRCTFREDDNYLDITFALNLDDSHSIDHDVTLEVGMFADFIELLDSDFFGDDTTPGLNSYKSFTLSQSSPSITFVLNMQYLSQFIPDTLWRGNACVLFQGRITDGLPTGTVGNSPSSTASLILPVAPSASDAAVTALFDPREIIYPGSSGCFVYQGDEEGIPLALRSGNRAIPYTVSNITAATETINGTKYFRFDMAPSGGETLYNRNGIELVDFVKQAIDAGAGTPDQSGEYKLTMREVALVGKLVDSSSNTVEFRPTLYCKPVGNSSGSPAQMNYNGQRIFGITAVMNPQIPAEITAAFNGNWYSWDGQDNERGESYLTEGSIGKQLQDETLDSYVLYAIDVPFQITEANNASTLDWQNTWYLSLGDTADKLDPLHVAITGGATLVDTTAPTVESISATESATYYPGDYMPITVTFSEPVSGDFGLVCKRGDDIYVLPHSVPIPRNNAKSYYRKSDILSKTRTFYYPVEETDSGTLQILGVAYNEALETAGSDLCNNRLDQKATLTNVSQENNPFGYSKYAEKSAQVGNMGGLRPQDSISSMSAALTTVGEDEIQTPDKFTVTVNLSSDTSFTQRWTTYGQSSGDYKDVEASIVVDGDTENRYPLTYKGGVLTCDLTLPRVDAATDHVFELWLSTIGASGGIYYGTYAEVTQQPTTMAGSDAYTIVPSGWPSGQEFVVYADNKTMPSFSYKDNGTSFTYKRDDLVYWSVAEGADLIDLTASQGTGDDLTLQNAQEVSFTTKGAGTVKLVLMATNGSEDTNLHTEASEPITFTIIDNGAPFLNASTVFARQGVDQIVTFSTNLYKHEMAEGGDLTATLYELDEKGAINAGTAVSLGTLDWKAASVTVPGSYLQNISQADAPTYAVRLTATVKVDDAKTRELSADALLVVRSQPAVITLTGLDTPYFMGGETLSIGWSVANFDTSNACQFELALSRGSEVIHSTTNVSDATGSYSMPLPEPTTLREYYILTVKAKNDKDPTWSKASSTITVYKNNALDLLVGGESVETVDLKNTIAETETTTAPTITSYAGETFSGLTTTEAVMQLRSELSLMDTISINYAAYDWDLDTDRIVWSTSTGQGEAISEDFQRAVTINYRDGNNYAPLEQYSFTSYIPGIIMLLCGLQDGTNQVTASHQYLDALTDTVTVNVERLQNKLYLFQFTPAARTEVQYTDALGNAHTVYSNDDGSLVLLEPNGIASEINTASISGGVSYRGTFSRYALKSGEGNGIYGELYPLNSMELRKAAVAEFQLLKPDGTPLANETVTLRGGVYRNRYLAEVRDDSYCANAKFAKSAGEAAILDGTQDLSFTTDANGMLSVHMDLQQLTSTNDPGAVAPGDLLEFIFELRFAGDAYRPEIVIVDGSLSYQDSMRTGEDIITLSEASSVKPFVATQTISYTGRRIDVRSYSGMVGPSSNYPQAELESFVMLWGMDDVAVNAAGYTAELKSQQTGVPVPEQDIESPAEASFPFSTIPLINNKVTLTSSSFANFEAVQRTPIEMVLCDDAQKTIGTLNVPFSLVDLSSMERVEDAPSVSALMANLAIYGSVGGANTEYGLVNSASNIFLKTGLSLLEKLGAKAGLVKSVLTPTEDPTRYTAYMWTGLNTTKLEDLDYDQNGIAIEPSYIGQDTESLAGQINDTFTLGDFQAMADGSYFDDPGNMYGQISQGVLQLPIMLVLEGWVSTEIRYNFQKGEWEVLTTGGGFTAGAQLEFEKAINGTPYGIPLTVSFKVRGGAVVNFEAAIRYAEQLGLEWNDETAQRVNDYLTALRINAYFEFFGGIGHDHGFVAKIGLFGTIEINNENRFLTRNYLKDPNQRDVRGQFLQLDGEAGIKAAVGVEQLSAEWTLVSIGFKNATWGFNKWNEIKDYWENATSGLGSTGWETLEDPTAPGGIIPMSDQTALLVSGPSIKLQSRDYLAQGQRAWLGGDMSVSTTALDTEVVKAIQTNSYPYSRPQISDDGGMLLYLSDNNSDRVEDTRVFYSRSSGSSFPAGTAIADPEGFPGYGDSSLSFDGTSDHAAAIWLRESNTLDLKAGVEVNEEEQLALLSGYEVVASIWNGSSWSSTRLTNNSSQEFNPVIAANQNGQAIAAWRSVQTTDSILEFTENSILCKVYNGTSWSDETYTLYNGSAGSVTGMSAELLDDGTAAIAFSVEDSSVTNEDGDDGNDIYYTVFSASSEAVEDEARTIRATTNTWRDENPHLTNVGDQFVLGWVGIQNQSGAEQIDISLRVLDKQGVPATDFPETLSQMISTASFDGHFAFVKGAKSLDELSILWNDADAGESSNDILRAVKFGRYGESYGASAPIEVAELPADTSLDYLDARAVNGTSVQAVLQATTMDAENCTVEPFTYKDDEGDHTIQLTIPGETSALYGAAASYSDSVAVSGVHVDFTTLTTNSVTPVTFDITNRGMNVLNEITIGIDGKQQTYTGLNLLPNQTKTLAAVFTTGSSIEDLPYTVEGSFSGGSTAELSDTLYLDYPDVGISKLTLTKEQDGERTILATLYNQSAASIAKSGRRVILGVYSDPECETPLNGKFFTDGTTDKAYELTLTGDTLTALDNSGTTQQLNFLIEDYVEEAGLTEIPDGGVTLFFRARIQQQVDGIWMDLPEADTMNNQKHLTFESLLVRSDGQAITKSSEITNGDTTSATVTIRNNSLQPNTSGYIVAALLDENGKLLETKQIGDLTLGCEEIVEKLITFSQSGSTVVLRYGEAVSDAADNANAASITLEGYPLSMESFDENGKAEVNGVTSGRHLLTVIPENPNAIVKVDGIVAENGMAEISMPARQKTVTVTITAPDGETEQTYTIVLIPDPKEIPISVYYTVTFETNGGTELEPVRALSGTQLNLSDYKTTRKGYVFTGWYLDEELTQRVTTLKLTGSTTLYAGWSIGSSPFTDVTENDWFYEDVLYVYENGLMNGTGNGLFSPNVTTTRGMIVTILHRLEGEPAVSGQNPFADVPSGSYYEAAITWAQKHSIVTGYSEERFGPDDPITREQMATILYRYAKYKGIDVSVGEDTNILSYEDAASISEYAFPAFQWACGAGILNGTGNGNLSPLGSATRAQVAAILHRFRESISQ